MFHLMKRNNDMLAIKFFGGQTGAYCCCPKANTLSVEDVLEDGKFGKNRVCFVLRLFVGYFLSLNKSWLSITC